MFLKRFMFHPMLLLLLGSSLLPGSYSIQPPSGNTNVNSPSSSSDPQVIKLTLNGQQPSNQQNIPNPFVLSRSFDPVAFSALHASQVSRRSVSKILFDNTITDIGFGWYSDRSEFICFYPGAYYFSFNALSTPTSQFKVSLMKNNEEIVSTWGEQSGYHAGSNSVILNLQKGDRVYLNIQEGAIHESRVPSRGYTTFSGFRIN